MLEKIKFHPVAKTGEPRFSILIPTWNNLEHIRLCVDSIRKNSRYDHQIILHVNDGSDGTREWIKDQPMDYTCSDENVGICYAINAMATLAHAEYLVYLNDDMYACPDWDHYLWEEIQALGHNNFLLGSAVIEPRDTAHPCMIYSDEFGNSLATFKEDLLLKKFQDLPKQDWCGAGGSAVVLHKRLWDLVGGYSVEFSPGMYSDADFNMKLWQAGVRHFKGVSLSRIFHFQMVSTGRSKFKKNDGRKQFAQKWGIPSSIFNRYYLRLGKPFNGPLQPPKNSLSLKWARVRAKLPF